MDNKKPIELSRAITVDGVETKTLTMREPLVMDQIAASEMSGSSAKQEVALFANLCEVPVEALHQVPLKDYVKLQEAYSAFLA